MKVLRGAAFEMSCEKCQLMATCWAASLIDDATSSRAARHHFLKVYRRAQRVLQRDGKRERVTQVATGEVINVALNRARLIYRRSSALELARLVLFGVCRFSRQFLSLSQATAEAPIVPILRASLCEHSICGIHSRAFDALLFASAATSTRCST